MDKGRMNVPLFSGNLIQKKTLKRRTGFRCFKILTMITFSILCNIGLATYSQENPGKTNPDETGITMTSFDFGGTGVLFTQVKGQFTAMTGGRGSATFNNRFTFGGAGWGMIKGVEVNSMDANAYQFFRFGYGGLEFGYVLLPGKRNRIGSNLLVAYGAGFNETVPASANTDFKMFPVLEPSVYWQLSMGKYLKLDVEPFYRAERPKVS